MFNPALIKMYFLCVYLGIFLSLSNYLNAQDVSLYAPSYVPCPANLTVRPASEGLSTAEIDWRAARLAHVLESIGPYLKRASIPGFNLNGYMNAINTSNVPIVGFAVSGGGSQSGLGGLGLWQAFDERYPPANAAGTGGLTQCMSYLSGLSGGGYLTTASLASNNFSTIEELRQKVNFSVDYNVGPTGNATDYITDLFRNAGAKAEEGFPVTVADIFGQFFSVYLPGSWKYRDYSDIARMPNHSFSLGHAPMPIISMAEIVPGSSPSYKGIMYPGLNSLNRTNFEMTPYEFGSWTGGRVQAFMPTQYVGSTMYNGTYVNITNCVNGFDKMSFAQGSTANAFNFYLLDIFSNETLPLFAKRDESKVSIAKRQSSPSGENPILELVDEINEEFNLTTNESLWATYPNPFLGYSEEMANVDELFLVDGSETGQTIPFWPLIQPERKVDFIIAFDSTGDGDNNWVNGTNMLDTSIVAKKAGIPFPEIPDAATMVNLNITQNPTFFGCDAGPAVPLVLYLPNSPWSAYTNYSYTLPSFTPKQLDLIFENDFNIATYGNGTIDSDWPACVACAVISNSLHRVKIPLPDICEQCWEKHCWNGTRAESPRIPGYDPRLRLDPTGLVYGEWNATVFY